MTIFDRQVGILNNPSVRGLIALEAWRWFHLHYEDEVIQRKVWLASITIRVKHLEPLFEHLFGPEPGSPQAEASLTV